MYVGSNEAFVEARFEEEVRRRFAAVKLENGAPAGDLVATSIILDRREADVPADRLAALSIDDMIDAYSEVTWLLFEAQSGGEVTLPFGTVATSERRGSLQIGPRHYVLDAGRPGLHEIEGVRRDAHGHNLALLQTLIRRKTARLACRRLGVPHGASVFDNIARQLLQFPPCEKAGGVVLQREAYGSGAERFCAATRDQIDEFAESIVKDMRRMWKLRRMVAARVQVVRAAADAAVHDAAPAAPFTLKALAVDMSSNDDEHAPSLYVEFNGLDEALRPGTILDYAPGRSENWKAQVDYAQRARREDAEVLRQQGADGWIDPNAATVAAMFPDGAAAALAPLLTEQETYLAISTPDGVMHTTLYWSNGTIKAEIDLPGKFSWTQNYVDLAAAGRPDCAVAALPDRAMATVFPAPLSSAGTIHSASELNNGGVRLKVEEPEWRSLRVNLSSGKVW